MGTGTCLGTAIFARHERSLRMANMTAAFIVGVLVPIGHMDGARAERWAGAVVGALLAVANFRFLSEFECRFKFGLGGFCRAGKCQSIAPISWDQMGTFSIRLI